MSKMLRLVEEMHVRLSEVAASEQALLQTLRDALSRVDDKLMQDVCTITAEHETKRRAALDELQSLASRIGAFPSARLSYAPAEGERLQSGPPAQTITDDLDRYFRVNASSH